MSSTLIKASTGDVVADRVLWARTPWARTRGLIGAPTLEPGTALILSPGKQVHTFGIAGPIDVVFCSESWVVMHVVSSMPRRRITRWVRGARYVVEMSPGGASDLRIGDQLSVVVSDRVR